MALHSDTEIYRATYSLTQMVTEFVANMPRNYKADFGAELRRRCMANAARRRGHAVDGDLTKVYRRAT